MLPFNNLPCTDSYLPLFYKSPLVFVLRAEPESSLSYCGGPSLMKFSFPSLTSVMRHSSLAVPTHPNLACMRPSWASVLWRAKGHFLTTSYCLLLGALQTLFSLSVHYFLPSASVISQHLAFLPFSFLSKLVLVHLLLKQRFSVFLTLCPPPSENTASPVSDPMASKCILSQGGWSLSENACRLSGPPNTGGIIKHQWSPGLPRSGSLIPRSRGAGPQGCLRGHLNEWRGFCWHGPQPCYEPVYQVPHSGHPLGQPVAGTTTSCWGQGPRGAVGGATDPGSRVVSVIQGVGQAGCPGGHNFKCFPICWIIIFAVSIPFQWRSSQL